MKVVVCENNRRWVLVTCNSIENVEICVKFLMARKIIDNRVLSYSKGYFNK